MQLQFPKSDIPRFAKKYCECFFTGNPSTQAEREKKLIAMRDEVSEQGYLDIDILQKVATWLKVQNVRRIENNNSENDVIERTHEALQNGDEPVLARPRQDGGLYGVGPVVATAILHFFHKDPYPILSRYSVKSFGEEERYNDSLNYWQEYVTFWQEYVTDCRTLAESATFEEMRTLDRALWWYANREV
ncbi:MAG: hypothetical protein OXI67_07755 [Candidatus Poribacteria bacterium]|nr:hypothetical protein [Candidatus Poribacteria bacterium]